MLYEVITEDMADAVARYGNLESGGWKADLGTAIHKDNDQGHFYTDMLTRAAHAGEAVVYEYLINNEVAASNLCVRVITSYSIHYTKLYEAGASDQSHARL